MSHDVDEFYREPVKPTYEELESKLRKAEEEVSNLKEWGRVMNGQCEYYKKEYLKAKAVIEDLSNHLFGVHHCNCDLASYEGKTETEGL